MGFIFFDALFPKTPEDGSDLGFVALAMYPNGVYDRDEAPSQNHYFAWPSQREDVVAFCFHNSSRDIYASPALFKTRGSRKGSNIAHQWAAYANALTLPLDRVKVTPTMTVQTAEGEHQLLWVTESDDPKALVNISRTIAETHSADGCDRDAWDAGQLLRVPGTTNNAGAVPGHPGWEIPQPSMGPSYTLAALMETYPPHSIESAASTASVMPPKADWYYSTQSIRESAEVFRASPKAYSLYSTDPKPDEDGLKELLALLARQGTSRLTAMHIAWDAKCNHFKIEGRHESELWEELRRAYDNPANQPVRNSFADSGYRKSVDESEENPEKIMAAFGESVEILTPGERDQIPVNTFVDRYVAWGATRTDAPHTYHRAGAATLLSAVFGEFGQCPTNFPMNLTLWFFILGPTTRARKTTAMSMWVDMLDDAAPSDFSYLLGSDITSEALSMLLPERNGRTSVFHRDEAHGFLYEQEQKRYLAGWQEHMTELFSGRARVAIRVNNLKEHGERATSVIRTNFLMFFCGTLDQVAERLDITDYQSGHLARFIVAEADPPPITEEGMYIDQFDGQTTDEDVARQGLINELVTARTFWMNITEPGKPVRVIFDPPAWKRLQKARYELYRKAENHELAKALVPTLTRMGDSTMKMAVLLAMVDRERTVKMSHTLKAMELTEEWYRATARVAGRILHSRWKSRQDELLTAIQSRKEGITEQDVYSRFRAKMTARDIESDLTVLAKSGLIHRVPERGRIRYVPIAKS